MDKTIENIRRYFLVEYYRNQELYGILESYDNAEELQWIHNMACFYMVEMALEEKKEEDIKELAKAIQDFEMEVRWYYRKGIEDVIEKLRVLLNERFISYHTYKQYIENKNEEEKQIEKEDKIWSELYSDKSYTRINHFIHSLSFSKL